MTGHLQIGEVAERTGLSLRTIRYYGEVDLVAPTSRSEGGFRLYTEADVERLQVVKRMKPLDYTLEEMRHVLATIDRLETSGPENHEQVVAELTRVRAEAEERRARLRAKLDAAEAFLAELDATLGASGRASRGAAGV